MTTLVFSSILLAVTEQIQPQDPRQLVGYPREPLRRLSRGERTAIKKLVKGASHDVDPVVAIRMALSSGASIRREWLHASYIDSALETEDIARNLDKLTNAKRLIDAVQVIEVLSRRAGRAPSIVLRALGKLADPRKGARALAPETMLDKDTAARTITLATALVPLLCGPEGVRSKKSTPQSLLEIVYFSAESWPAPEIAIAGLEFLRVLDRQVGWAEAEKPSMETMRKFLLSLPGSMIREILQRVELVEATRLSERVRVSEQAETIFKAAVADILANEGQLPLASKNWARLFLQTETAPDPLQLMQSDAAYERLALVLINAWEAREDGSNAAHAFSLCEEVFRNGFNIYLGGDVGATVAFDLDVFASGDQLLPGAMVRIVRPWVELKSPGEVRILIKGRVIAA